MCSFVERCKARAVHAWKTTRSLISQRSAMMMAMMMVALVIAIAPSVAHAQTPLVADAILTGIANLVGVVVAFLGGVFTFLTDVFLGFAQYNSFGSARAVQVGWVIVRDVCNMFFIVVLLVSAFSTIIPWDSSLRYDQVLPKLLLSAILINFSKLFIQLMIDASQVVTLTFVNAFHSAGAGNFAALFRVTSMVSMSRLSTGTVTGELISQLLASYILAMVLMIIACGVMVIMIVYILARIVGLWMLIIFSPLAFFMNALPGKLQGGVSGQVGKYWGMLGGLLTGGPVVMFFIYLSFAILQAPGAPNCPNPAGENSPPLAQQLCYHSTADGDRLAGRTDTTAAQGATTFVTNIGTADEVASFIIGVVLMLMALEAATSSANSVSSVVGNFASKVGNVSKSLAYGGAALAATSPFIAAKLAYRTVDRRADVTNKLSRGAFALTSRIPVLNGLTRKTLMAGMTMNRRREEAETQEIMSATNGMSAGEKRQVLGSFRSNVARGAGVERLTDTRGEQRTAAVLAQNLASKEVRDQEASEIRRAVGASAENDPVLRNLSASERQAAIAERTEKAMVMHQRDQLQEQEHRAKQIGDVSMLDEIDALREKDMRLYASDEERDAAAKTIVDDTSKSKEVTKDAAADTEVLTRLLEQAKILDIGRDGKLVDVDSDNLKAFVNAIKPYNKELAGNLDYWGNFMKNSIDTAGGGAASITREQAMQAKVTEGDDGVQRAISTANVARGMFGLGNAKTSVKASMDSIKAGVKNYRTGAGGTPQPTVQLRNLNQERAINDLAGHVAAGTTTTPAAADALENYMEAGGTIADLAAYDPARIEEVAKGLFDKYKTAIEGSLAAGDNDGVPMVKIGNVDNFVNAFTQLANVMRGMGKPGVSPALDKARVDAFKNMNLTIAAMPLAEQSQKITDALSSAGVYNQLPEKMRRAIIDAINASNKDKGSRRALLGRTLDRMAGGKKQRGTVAQQVAHAIGSEERLT